MRSSLAVISSVLSIFLLFSAGCEPEPQAPAPAPEQVQAEADIEQQPELTQEQIEAARAEMEEMVQLAQQEQAAEQAKAETTIEEPVTPEPAPVETVTPEPEPVVPDEQVVQETLPQVEPEPEAPQTSPDDVMVTVNGIDIKRAKIDEMVNTRLDQIKASSRGRKLDDASLNNMKERLSKGAIEAAIIETLIAQKMQEHNVTISAQQIEEHIAQMAARQKMTVEDLKDIITSRGQTYEQWKEQMQFDKRIGVLKLTEIEGMGTPDVNDADVLKVYEEGKARYETPEQVKASHILIKPDDSPTADPNTADADARAKAEELLAQIKDGADFAQLAMENSACPSSSKGGDLGFGQRRSWVKPFADAAFAMQPGEISDVVKTRFGYHIIKTTERKEAGLTPFDEVKDQILKMLQAGREAERSSKYVKSLRASAEVVYPQGQQPDESELPVQ